LFDEIATTHLSPLFSGTTLWLGVPESPSDLPPIFRRTGAV